MRRCVASVRWRGRISLTKNCAGRGVPESDRVLPDIPRSPSYSIRVRLFQPEAGGVDWNSRRVGRGSNPHLGTRTSLGSARRWCYLLSAYYNPGVFITHPGTCFWTRVVQKRYRLEPGTVSDLGFEGLDPFSEGNATIQRPGDLDLQRVEVLSQQGNELVLRRHGFLE